MFTDKELRIIWSAFNQVKWDRVKGTEQEKVIICDKLTEEIKRMDYGR